MAWADSRRSQRCLGGCAGRERGELQLPDPYLALHPVGNTRSSQLMVKGGDLADPARAGGWTGWSPGLPSHLSVAVIPLPPPPAVDLGCFRVLPLRGKGSSRQELRQRVGGFSPVPLPVRAWCSAAPFPVGAWGSGPAQVLWDVDRGRRAQPRKISAGFGALPAASAVA